MVLQGCTPAPWLIRYDFVVSCPAPVLPFSALLCSTLPGLSRVQRPASSAQRQRQRLVWIFATATNPAGGKESSRKDQDTYNAKPHPLIKAWSRRLSSLASSAAHDKTKLPRRVPCLPPFSTTSSPSLLPCYFSQPTALPLRYPYLVFPRLQPGGLCLESDTRCLPRGFQAPVTTCSLAFASE